ncbi:MAG: GNAT family N-acetyltransferase [Bdellovibrio sp.]
MIGGDDFKKNIAALYCKADRELSNLKSVMDKFEILKNTEIKIQTLHKPPRGTRPGALGFWKNISEEHSENSELFLIAVDSEDTFKSLAALRTSFFGASEENIQEISDSLDFVRRCQSELGAKWFLLKDKEIFVGEIGIVPFSFGSFRLGRLQDVEISPSFHGRGYGNQLLKLAFGKAQEMGLSALCLKARPNDWTSSWYERNGFFKIGTW